MIMETVIPLFSLIGDGVVIAEAPTGIVYTNQAGGVRCQHPRMEGYIICTMYPSEVLSQSFAGWGDLDMARVDLIDEDFSIQESLRDIKISIDRERLDESMEGWLYVNIEISDESNFGFSGPKKLRGVFTWEGAR